MIILKNILKHALTKDTITEKMFKEILDVLKKYKSN